MRMLKNKRGALTDIFVWLVVSFTLALVCVLFFYIGNVTYTELQGKAPFLQQHVGDENASQIIDKTFGYVPIAFESLKWITFMLIVGMLLAMLITSFMVKVHPVFFVPYIIISIIAVIVSVPMSNTYAVVYNHPELASSFSGFYGQQFIFANLPIWVTTIMFMVGIVLFVNMMKRNEEFGGYGG